MSLGLSLSGKYPLKGILVKGPSPSEWLGTLDPWLRKREGDELVSLQVVEGADGEVLLAQLHPFAEELQVACPKAGEVRLTAMTLSCGPGYHRHVVDLAHAMSSELGVAWTASGDEDDTGFFRSGDVEGLEAAHVAAIAEAARAVPASDVASLLLPVGPSIVIHGSAVATPLGPRDARWLQDVRDGHARALDAVPWRERGHGGSYFRNRGLALCWCAVRWAPPAMEAEEQVQAEVDRCFERALDAGETALPWAEWASLAAFREDDTRRTELAARAAGLTPSIGYRRGDMLMRLPDGFLVRLPGSMLDVVDEEGTWTALSDERQVYATAERAPNASDGPGDAMRLLAKLPMAGEPFEHRHGTLVGRAALRQDEDEGVPVHVLSCGVAQGSALLRATFVFRREADREWAVAAFRSITRDVPGAGTATALPGITG